MGGAGRGPKGLCPQGFLPGNEDQEGPVLHLNKAGLQLLCGQSDSLGEADSAGSLIPSHIPVLKKMFCLYFLF